MRRIYRDRKTLIKLGAPADLVNHQSHITDPETLRSYVMHAPAKEVHPGVDLVTVYAVHEIGGRSHVSKIQFNQADPSSMKYHTFHYFLSEVPHAPQIANMPGSPSDVEHDGRWQPSRDPVQDGGRDFVTDRISDQLTKAGDYDGKLISAPVGVFFYAAGPNWSDFTYGYTVQFLSSLWQGDFNAVFSSEGVAEAYAEWLRGQEDLVEKDEGFQSRMAYDNDYYDTFECVDASEKPSKVDLWRGADLYDRNSMIQIASFDSHQVVQEKRVDVFRSAYHPELYLISFAIALTPQAAAIGQVKRELFIPVLAKEVNWINDVKIDLVDVLSEGPTNAYEVSEDAGGHVMRHQVPSWELGEGEGWFTSDSEVAASQENVEALRRQHAEQAS